MVTLLQRLSTPSIPTAEANLSSPAESAPQSESNLRGSLPELGRELVQLCSEHKQCNETLADLVRLHQDPRQFNLGTFPAVYKAWWREREEAIERAAQLSAK